MTGTPDQRITTLGRTGLVVGRIGLSASYGAPAAAIERGFEAGMNYLYWGSIRRGSFQQALRNLAPRRDRMVLVLQSFSRLGWLMDWSVERALRQLRFDHADVLLLGMWNRPIPARILDRAHKLLDRGLVRFLAVSTHHRPLVQTLAHDPNIGIVHTRYNAIHRGAEQDVFPYLASPDRPGLVSFTATSWGQLIRAGASGADCYRFVLTQPAVDLCLSGPSSAAHVDDAIAALRRGPMDPDELDRMRRLGDQLYRRR